MMRTVWAFVAGALVGAGVALLLAPATGRRMRALIRDRATHYAHGVQHFVGSRARQLRHAAGRYAHRERERMGLSADGGQRPAPEEHAV